MPFACRSVMLLCGSPRKRGVACCISFLTKLNCIMLTCISFIFHIPQRDVNPSVFNVLMLVCYDRYPTDTPTLNEHEDQKTRKCSNLKYLLVSLYLYEDPYVLAGKLFRMYPHIFLQHQHQVAQAVERSKHVSMADLNAIIGVSV